MQLPYLWVHQWPKKKKEKKKKEKRIGNHINDTQNVIILKFISFRIICQSDDDVLNLTFRTQCFWFRILDNILFKHSFWIVGLCVHFPWVTAKVDYLFRRIIMMHSGSSGANSQTYVCKQRNQPFVRCYWCIKAKF